MAKKAMTKLLNDKLVVVQLDEKSIFGSSLESGELAAAAAGTTSCSSTCTCTSTCSTAIPFAAA